MSTVFDPLRMGAVSLDMLVCGRASQPDLAGRQHARLRALLAAAVRGAIHEQDLRLPFWRLVEIRHQSTRLMTDPDGKTTHGVMTFRALADPA